MIVFVPINFNEKNSQTTKPKYDGLQLSLEDFLNFSFDDPDFKYEWNNGFTEAEFKMKNTERKIMDSIIRKFVKTKAFLEGGNILPEADIHLTSVNTYRRPDASFFSKEQIQNPSNSSPVPSFVIEIISPNNSSLEVEKKLKEYFSSNIQVVWLIYPEIKEVKIYTSLKNIQICISGDICSVPNVIPDLSISIDELFN